MIKICDGNGKFIYLFGAWIPFDDGSRERVSELVSAFSLIESYISNYIDPNNDHVILMCDLNCDPSRCNRFDSIYLHFFNENKFIDYFDFFQQEFSYTYENGNYKSRIDHCIMNKELFTRILDAKIISDSLNLSDHLPLRLILNDDSNGEFENFKYESSLESLNKYKKFHFFNFSDNFFKKFYICELKRFFNLL